MNTSKKKASSKRGLGRRFPIPRESQAQLRAIFKRKFEEHLRDFFISMEQSKRSSTEIDDLDFEGMTNDLCKVLFQTWGGNVINLINKNFDLDKVDNYSTNLLIVLMKFSRLFVEPEKPSAIGSKSKMKGYEDPLIPLVARIEADLKLLDRQLNQEPWMGSDQKRWIPVEAQIEFDKGYSHVLLSIKALRRASSAGFNKSKKESELYRQLVEQFGNRSARDIVNELIDELERIGFILNPNVKNWYDRVRLKNTVKR